MNIIREIPQLTIIGSKHELSFEYSTRNRDQKFCSYNAAILGLDRTHTGDTLSMVETCIPLPYLEIRRAS
jgi:hypothetical protein